MASKIFGWFLLIAGVVILCWMLWSSYNIFTGKVEVSELFQMEQEKETVLSQQGGAEDMQAQMQQMIGEQLKGILPANTIPKMLNLAAWSILAGIFIFGSTQLSGIGIKLIKK